MRSHLSLGIGILVLFSAVIAKAQPAHNEVGWAQPYSTVSPKSVTWLKEKGWWPLTMAWQPSFSGQNATVMSMVQNELLQKRGLEFRLEAKTAGVAVNSALIEGAAQIGAGGNFPLTLLVDQNAPVRVVAITAPNLRHQVIVPTGSNVKSLKDFKGHQPPAVIGMVLGSSSEFYFQASAAANGLKVGRDVVLKNLSQSEQIKLPAEVAAIVPWDPVSTLVTRELRTGRAIDVSYPYNVYQGSFLVRSELIDTVPDVALAITEALVEGDLWLRSAPDKVAKFMAQQPQMAGLPESLLRQQIDEYNLLYKPSYMYPLGRFWGTQNQDVALWLSIHGKLKRALTRSDFDALFAPGPMEKIYTDLGWKKQLLPPFIAPDWMLKPRGTRLPDYDIFDNMKSPQPWPEAKDLTKPYSFGGKTYRP